MYARPSDTPGNCAARSERYATIPLLAGSRIVTNGPLRCDLMIAGISYSGTCNAHRRRKSAAKMMKTSEPRMPTRIDGRPRRFGSTSGVVLAKQVHLGG